MCCTAAGYQRSASKVCTAIGSGAAAETGKPACCNAKTDLHDSCRCELPANGQNDSEAAEQKLHILLYKSTLPENDLNQALDELRTERRRQKAEYQGTPFADVFLVNLILSDEDSERACIVDVGDTGMSYVIPWSSIPKDLQESLHRYVSEAEGKLCGYCKEELCNSESGRMVVELYLGKQDGHGSRILY